jgi:hypothetical protein
MVAPMHKGQEVVAVHDLRDVPAGTRGKVLMAVGFTWPRCHVLFDNGVQMSSLDEHSIAAAETRHRAESPGLATPWAEPPHPSTTS